MKKIFALILALAMVMGLAISATAQTVSLDPVSADNASITITNASKGETYKIYKLFDATVTGTAGDSIAYTGTIPASLADYFEADSVGNISVKANVKNDDLFEALKTWAKSASETKSAESDGSQLTFAGLDYGYYVVTSSQENGTAITVTSTNPTATVVDKNESLPTVPVKKVNGKDSDDVMIGETVTYTVTFRTANYNGEGTAAQKITSYTINDNLPSFLSNAKVTSITVGGDPITIIDFDATGNVVIPWVATNGDNLYANGAEVIITYTAMVNENAAIGTENTNTVVMTWAYGSGETAGTGGGTTGETQYTDNASVLTYEFDLVKTEKPSDTTSAGKNILSGAKFKLQTATTTGEGETAVTTYTDIQLIKINDGYRVATPAEIAAEGFTPAVIEAGNVTIKGLANGTYYLEETEAPAGYNKLTARQSVTIENGNLDATLVDGKYQSGGVEVENSTGSELPSTGGMGTTIFYVVGGLLTVGAVVLLVTKKRMSV